MGAMDPSTYDFENDKLPPKDVLEQVVAHDARIREHHANWALFDAMYNTEFWEHIQGAETARATEGGLSLSSTFTDRIEVNRVKPAVSAYLASLFPRALQATFFADPAGHGDPLKAQLVIERWINTSGSKADISDGSRQTLMWGMCGSKVFHRPGTASALDRVELRIFPRWELVVDDKVHHRKDQRFIGHIYDKPVHEVEEEYDLKGLKGQEQRDFLSSNDPAGAKTSHKQNERMDEEAPSDATKFVRVLELINLVDDYVDSESGQTFKGRLEIYVFGQNGDVYRKPVWLGPLPYAKADGSPRPHINALVFDHKASYPLRGLPYVRQIAPQQTELNVFRSKNASDARRDARQYAAHPKAFKKNTLTDLEEGKEGVVHVVHDDFPPALMDKAIVPIRNGEVSRSIIDHAQKVEQELQGQMVLSPGGRMEVSKATAYEVQNVERYSETEFGRYAAARDAWLEETYHLVLRAVIAAMQDPGEAEAGQFDDVEADLAPVGASDDSGDQPEVDLEAEVAMVLEDDGEDPFAEEELEEDELVDEDEQDLRPLDEGEADMSPEGQVEEEEVLLLEASSTGVEVEKEGDPLPMVDEEVVLPEQALILITEDRRLVEVFPLDLDAAFRIEITEGGRTPTKEAEVKGAIVALQPQMLEMWKLATDEAAGPLRVFGREWLRTVAELHDMPRRLHPDFLFQRWEEMQEEEPQEPAPEALEAAEAPPVEGESGVGQHAQVLQMALELPPADAINLLMQAFGSDPQIAQMLQQVGAMPPEAQMEGLQAIVGAIAEMLQGAAESEMAGGGMPPAPNGMM